MKRSKYVSPITEAVYVDVCNLMSSSQNISDGGCSCNWGNSCANGHPKTGCKADCRCGGSCGCSCGNNSKEQFNYNETIW